MMAGFMYTSVLLVLAMRFTSTLANNCLLPTGDSGEPCTCCKSGYAGDDCTTSCPNCERTRIGETCIDVCRPGFYGRNCNVRCSENCIEGSEGVPFCKKRNGECEYGCKPGYFGRQCRNKCSTACLKKECFQEDGKCYQCNNTRYHGPYCNEICNSGCYNGTCHINGFCNSGCNSGRYGLTCGMECGDNCINHRCSTSRSSGFYCTDGCKDGFTLQNCIGKCPENCRKCHQNSSQCISCMHGFVTHCDKNDCDNGRISCNQVTAKRELWWITLIVLIIVLLIIAVVLFIMYRRRKPAYYKVAQDDTVLHKACREGDLDCVKSLLTDKESDINSKAQRGMTPVMVAVDAGQRRVAKFLINQNCDLTLVNDKSDTVLHIACQRNDVQTVRHILKRKTFDINIKGSHERTALMIAAHNGKTELFDLLKEDENIDLHLVDDVQDNVLNIACKSRQIDFLKHLLELNITDINLKGGKGRSPMLNAAAMGSTELFEVLKKCNCDLTVVDVNGDNALNIACYNDGNADFVECLLTMEGDHQFDINLRGYRGRTPVMIAARHGCERVFKVLVRHRCDLSMTDEENETVLGLACTYDHVEFVEYLLTLDPFKSDVNIRGSHGRTPLMTAVKHGRRKVFELLMRKGGNPKLMDNNKDTCWTIASRSGNVGFKEFMTQTYPEHFGSQQ